MEPVNMLQAKTSLARRVEATESGREAEIVIARNGRPVARLMPMGAPQSGARLFTGAGGA